MNKKRFSNEKKGLVFFSFLLLFIFMIGVTSAAIDTNDVDDVFKVNDRITYAKPCINNGTFCSSTAVCNFSFFDPNNQVIVDNEQGDNQVSRHEINVTLNTIGVWKVDMVCHDGDRQGAETYFAQVSGGGFNDSLGFLVIIALFSFGVITLGFYLPDGWITILGCLLYTSPSPRDRS